MVKFRLSQALVFTHIRAFLITIMLVHPSKLNAVQTICLVQFLGILVLQTIVQQLKMLILNQNCGLLVYRLSVRQNPDFRRVQLSIPLQVVSWVQDNTHSKIFGNLLKCSQEGTLETRVGYLGQLRLSVHLGQRRSVVQQTILKGSNLKNSLRQVHIKRLETFLRRCCRVVLQTIFL